MNLDLPNGKNRKPCVCEHAKTNHVKRSLAVGYEYLQCRDTRCSCAKYVEARVH